MDKVDFKDLSAQYPNRYRLDPVSGQTNVYEMTPARGTVTQAGTPVIAQSMNQLQDNVAAAVDANAETAENAVNAANAANNTASAAATTAASAVMTANEAVAAVANLENTYGYRAFGTPTGNPITLHDVSPLGTLTWAEIQGRTTQAGTPTPDAPVSITGTKPTKLTVMGRNLFDASLAAYDTPVLSNASYELIESGIRVTAVTAGNSSMSIRLPLWLLGQTVTVSATLAASASTANPSISLRFAQGNSSVQIIGTESATGSFTATIPDALPPNTDRLILRFYVNYGNAQAAAGDSCEFTVIQIEVGSTASSYQPYQGIAHSLPTLTTMHGNSTLYDTYDAATGAEWRKWKAVTWTGAEAWKHNASTANYITFALTINDLQYDTPSGFSPGWCSHMPYGRGIGTIGNNWVLPPTGSADHNLYVRINYQYLGVTIDDTADAKVAAMKDWLAAQSTAGTPVMIVYRLTQPTTMQREKMAVTPYAPYCTIAADAGTLDIEYNRDINIAYAEQIQINANLQEQIDELRSLVGG